MQSFPSDFVTSDSSQFGAWGTFPYGYNDLTMPGSDWFTSLATDLDGSPLTYDTELQQKEPPYSVSLSGNLHHRISPLDSPIEVAEADSTQHHSSYQFPLHQHHHHHHLHGHQNGAPDLLYQNQKPTQPPSKLAANGGDGGARFVPHGYYSSGSLALPSTGGAPPLTQSSMYPSPPGQTRKHVEASPYSSSKPYGLLYMNGDHGPQPMPYSSDAKVPFGSHGACELYQPYAGVATPTYEGNLPSFQSVLPTGIESVMPSVKYDWGTSTGSPMSSGTNQTSPSDGHCFIVKEEYVVPQYQSPSPSSLAGDSSIKAELLSDTSRTSPALVASTLSDNMPPMETPSPHLVTPLEPPFVVDNGAIITLENIAPASVPQTMTPATTTTTTTAVTMGKKHARISNSYGALFSCPECERTFARQCGLTQHMKWHHSGDKPFRCTICGKCFSGESALAHHFNRHSAVDKPHRCSACPKAFFHKNDLRRHVYQHTGTAPHNCKYCGKAFARKDHCHSHEFSHERKVERQDRKSKARERSASAKLANT